MRRKNKGRMIALALIIGILAAIPASTQVLSGDRTDANDEANLGMVILINRLELTRDQMETIHDSLASILSEIDELDSSREAFYDQMLQFNGTADELDQALSAFRDQMSAAESALRDDMKAAIDRIAETLTMKQGEILRQALPGLFAPEAGPRFGTEAPDRMRERITERLHSERGSFDRGRWGIGEQVPGEVQSEAGEVPGALPRFGTGGPEWMRQRIGVQSGAGELPGGVRGKALMMRNEIGKKVEILRQFVETLELKLNYLE